MKFKLILLCFILFIFQSNAATIHGVLKDHDTKEELIGAVVHINNTNFSASTGLDGTYVFKNVPVGTYTVTVLYMGYEQEEKTIVIENDDQKIHVDFSMQPKAHELKDVVIQGELDRESAESALHSEKNADNVMNVISAKTIQLLPDITVASVLQRVSGVSLERTSSGDARYAIIRGMDQRYNYTLVNGVKIPSPDNKFRYVPMDMFPADMVERIEVIKALTPNMEGDAIGGAMNLVMKDAPKTLTINANAGSGFSQLLSDRGYQNFDKHTANSQSPADINGPDYLATPKDFSFKNSDYSSKNLPLNSVLGFSIGNRFLKNKKLGIIISGSYQNVYRGANSAWFKQGDPLPGNIPGFNDIIIRQYNTNQTRYGFHSKLDYKFNAAHKISLYNVFMEMDEVQYRHTIDTSLTSARKGPGTGQVDEKFRSRIQNQSIYSSTLRGDHNFLGNHFKFDWSGVYSIAQNKVPNWSEVDIVHTQGGSADDAIPHLGVSLPIIWMRNSDKDLAGYSNLSYENKNPVVPFTLTTGGMYRDKHRDNIYNEYDLIPKTSGSTKPIYFNDVQTLNPSLFTDFAGNTAAQGSPGNALTYTAYEKVWAAYAQAKLTFFKKLEVLGGVRYESTSQGWNTALDLSDTASFGKKSYGSVLPSIHFKYMINSRQNLRLSYYSAINRPSFYEYIPFTINGETYTEGGNWRLKHATSNNYDVRYEFFPKQLDQLLVGAFYKSITNPIELAILDVKNAVMRPYNFGNATNYGIEVAFAKYWGVFGISGNYTYTHSSITTTKINYIHSPTTGADTNITVNQTRPLQGQSANIANISALYKNPKIGFDMQVALVYTGRKITLISPYLNQDYWQKGTTQLDLSVEKKLYKHFIIYCKVTNILNTPVVVEIMQNNTHRTGQLALPDQTSNNAIIVQKDYYGQNYIAGVRFKF